MAVKRKIVNVVIDDGDGEKELTVTTDNRDILAYERTRARQGWAKVDDGGAFTFITFLAWSALYRAGDIKTDMKTFMEDQCLAAEPVEAEAVDPTQTDRPTGT